MLVTLFFAGARFFYGINANQFAFRTQRRRQIPSSLIARIRLLRAGDAQYSSLELGATQQNQRARTQADQAQLDLTLAQRTLQSNVATAQAEATLAQAHLDSLRSSVDLEVESLRLTVLRYQAGEATALEVVDSQNTVTLSRNAYDDGLARYRVALTNLQILQGRYDHESFAALTIAACFCWSLRLFGCGEGGKTAKPAPAPVTVGPQCLAIDPCHRRLVLHPISRPASLAPAIASL